MGNNSAGNKNEDIIRDAINERKIFELNDNLREFIKFIHPSIKNDDVIKCRKIAGQKKCDLAITIDNIETRVSVKSGGGNSVHQEKVEEFIYFLDEKYKIDDSTANDIRFFIWGDKTLDGIGDEEDRLSGEELRERYPSKIQRIKNFFEKNKKDLIERFLLTGASGDLIDVIYHGDKNKGVWATREEFEPRVLVTNTNSKVVIPVGQLSFQAWNRAISGSNSEDNRGQIQLKWGGLKTMLTKIRNL